MKTLSFLNRGMALSLVALMLGVSSTAMAKSINLYDQPKADGKVINTIDSNVGIIAIFTPKEGGWVKVADPRNGNVGWVKSADLQGVGVNMNIMQTGDGARGYQMMQLGGFSLTPEQIATMKKQMEVRQQAIQNDMNKMVTDIYNNMHQYWMNVPMMMPVIIVPEAKLPANESNQPSVKGGANKASDKK